MFLGQVTGTVVATAKRNGLTGRTLVLVERVSNLTDDKEVGIRRGRNLQVAVDMVGASEGSLVLVCTGSAARLEAGGDLPVDLAVVGIVDYVVRAGEQFVP